MEYIAACCRYKNDRSDERSVSCTRNTTALLGREKEFNWESAWANQMLLRAFCRLALDLYECKSDWHGSGGPKRVITNYMHASKASSHLSLADEVTLSDVGGIICNGVLCLPAARRYLQIPYQFRVERRIHTVLASVFDSRSYTIITTRPQYYRWNR